MSNIPLDRDRNAAVNILKVGTSTFAEEAIRPTPAGSLCCLRSSEAVVVLYENSTIRLFIGWVSKNPQPGGRSTSIISLEAPERVFSLAFSPDSTLLLSGGNTISQVWGIAN